MRPEVAKKFEKKNKQVFFIGELCECFVSKRLDTRYKVMSIEDTVKTIGFFDMTVDGIETGLILPAVLEMKPSSVDTVTIGTDIFYKLTFKKNDLFLISTEVVMNPAVTFPIYKEIFNLGHVLKSLKYDDISFTFDKITEVSGLKFPINHAVAEMVPAQLARKNDDIRTLYRHTDMTKPYQLIPLNDNAHAATSTTSRVIGAWAKDGVNAALVNENNDPSIIEDLLRQ